MNVRNAEGIFFVQAYDSWVHVVAVSYWFSSFKKHDGKQQ